MFQNYKQPVLKKKNQILWSLRGKDHSNTEVYFLKKNMLSNGTRCAFLRKCVLARCETQMWNWTHTLTQSNRCFQAPPPSSWPCFYFTYVLQSCMFTVCQGNPLLRVLCNRLKKLTNSLQLHTHTHTHRCEVMDLLH